MIPPSPTPAEVKAARLAAGLTQTKAGELIYCCSRTWQKWEYGEVEMNPALWELWNIKIGRIK